MNNENIESTIFIADIACFIRTELPGNLVRNSLKVLGLQYLTL